MAPATPPVSATTEQQDEHEDDQNQFHETTPLLKFSAGRHCPRTGLADRYNAFVAVSFHSARPWQRGATLQAQSSRARAIFPATGQA
jgi:hypothetical protein